MISERQRAPDFTGTDHAGNSVRLADLRGKPVILHFFAVAWSGT